MTARPAAYYEGQRAYDAERQHTPKRTAQRKEARKRYDKKPTAKRKRAGFDAARKDRSAARRIIGVDGEGHDTPDGRHIYTYLAAVDEHGVCVSEAYNPEGLTHEQCAEMLLAIPRNSLKFGFMFSYDVTKIIEEMSPVDRYYLMRPNIRGAKACKNTDCKKVFGGEAKACPACGGREFRSYTRSLRWRGRMYGFFNGSLSIGIERNQEKGIGARSCKVWDCFRFFGCSFVEALKSWSPKEIPPEERVATEEQIARILEMKNKRGAFETEAPEAVKAYCREECHLLAVMMRKLIQAHDDAGIHLTRYEGAGSTATALLKKFEVQLYRGPRAREMAGALAEAVACAFFGGRFENSGIGKFKRKVHGFDVSSAYPYALSFLPCLACGTWERVTGRRAVTKALKNAGTEGRLCLAQFRVRAISPTARKKLAWGPLPFRSAKGSITYGTNFRGWAWAPELVPALEGALWKGLVDLTGEAWVYETKCNHNPFAFLPGIYRERCRWGKDGKGIPLKLGPNATYGKTAQSIGEDPAFQSWVWAGMTTATCRGQLLGGIAGARDPWNVLALATDGILATEMLDLPAPRDTGTFDVKNHKGNLCPLGGWEHKPVPEGVFLAKPGLYYRLNPELGDVRARGVGRREVYASRTKIERTFARWDRHDMNFAVHLKSRRFYGAKHSIFARATCSACGKGWPGVAEEGCPSCGKRGDGFKTTMLERADGKVAYGTWDLRDVRIAFDPHPKRERAIRKGGTSARLHLRDLGGATSATYKPGMTTPEGEIAKMAKEIMLEQEDWIE